MTKFLRHEKEIQKDLTLETDSDEVISPDIDSNRGQDEDSATVDCDNNTSESKVHVWSRAHHICNSGTLHPFTGAPCGLRIQLVPQVKRDSTPIIFFPLFFMEVIQQRLIDTITNI